LQHLRAIDSNYVLELEQKVGSAAQLYERARQLLDTFDHTQPATVERKEVQAVASTILNVYESYSMDKTDQMQGLSRTRELMRKCSWDSEAVMYTDGPASACFWFQRRNELLFASSFGIPWSWDFSGWKNGPETWSVPEPGRHGECLWTHKLIYLITNVATFLYGNEETTALEDPTARVAKWESLKYELDEWCSKRPQRLQPLALIESGNSIYDLRSDASSFQSRFPQIYIHDRRGVFTHITCHLGIIMLGRAYPIIQGHNQATEIMLNSARMLCGTIRQIEDRLVLCQHYWFHLLMILPRGVTSLAIRSLALAGEVLKDIREQDEILVLLRHLEQEFGWKTSHIEKQLLSKWGRYQGASSIPSEAMASSISTMSMPATPIHTNHPSIEMQSAKHHLNLAQTMSTNYHIASPHQTMPASPHHQTMAPPHQGIPPYHPHNPYGQAQAQHQLPMIQTASSHDSLLPGMAAPHTPMSSNPQESRPYHPPLMQQLLPNYQISPDRQIPSTSAMAGGHLGHLQSPHAQQMHSMSMNGLPSPENPYGGPY
jgi:hypothetical protein